VPVAVKARAPAATKQKRWQNRDIAKIKGVLVRIILIFRIFQIGTINE
jgi:hypothetical protein